MARTRVQAKHAQLRSVREHVVVEGEHRSKEQFIVLGHGRACEAFAEALEGTLGDWQLGEPIGSRHRPKSWCRRRLRWRRRGERRRGWQLVVN